MAKLNKVKVINNTTGSYSFFGIDDKKYLFTHPKSYKMIDMNIIEGCYNDYPAVFTGGDLIFEDKSVYESLGIEEDVYKTLITLDEIVELLNGDADKLAEKLDDMPDTIKENLAITAKEKGIDSKKKIKTIKEKTGFNVESDEDLYDK